jgi:dihydrofolate reductase
MSETQGITLVRSTEELFFLPNSSGFFVIGGAEIYRLLLPYCEELFVTHVSGEVVGDTSFPEFETAFAQGELIFETNDFKTLRYRRLS